DQSAAQHQKVGRLARQQTGLHGADRAEHAVEGAAGRGFEGRAYLLDQAVRGAAAQEAQNLHGAFRPACWMTLAHFSMSPLRKVSNWAGVMVMGSAPCL